MTTHARRTALVVVFVLAAFAAWPSAQDRPLQVPDRKSTRPTPRTASGKPDLSGYWKGTRETGRAATSARICPGWKLPLTPAGEAALKHNLTATIDPESLCIIGGIPRHNASGLPFEIVQGANKVVFLYWYSYFRAIPIDPKRQALRRSRSLVLR